MTDWHRLHPLSPLVRAGRGLFALVFILITAIPSGGTSGWSAAGQLGLVVAVAALGFVSWLVTRWRIEGNDLRIETGLVRRSSMRYPLSQIQAIDTVRPGLARIFGLSELRLRMGGGGGAARLAYLKERDADELRARLLALSQGAHESTPEPREQLLVQVPPARVLGALLLSVPALVLVVYAVVAAAIGGRVILGFALPILLGDAAALWRRFNRSYNASVAVAPEGLRTRAGLVETHAETIPRGRVQAVQLVEPLLWRPFGWCRLEVDVAGRVHDQSDERGDERQLRSVLPVGTRREADQLLEVIAPAAPAPGRKPPARARWKSPLRYRRLSYGFDDTYAVATTGRLARISAWVPLTKVQSFRSVEGPVQKRLRIATLHLDTAGKNVGVALRDLDSGESRADLERLIELARAARRR